MGGAGASMDVVGAVGFGTFAMGNSSAAFVTGDFSASADDAGGFAFAFDFFFGGFFIESASGATIHGPWVSTFFLRLARDLLPPRFA